MKKTLNLSLSLLLLFSQFNLQAATVGEQHNYTLKYLNKTFKQNESFLYSESNFNNILSAAVEHAAIPEQQCPEMVNMVKEYLISFIELSDIAVPHKDLGEAIYFSDLNIFLPIVAQLEENDMISHELKINLRSLLNDLEVNQNNADFNHEMHVNNFLNKKWTGKDLHFNKKWTGKDLHFNKKWTGKDLHFIEAFSDVFKASSGYWDENRFIKARRPPRWVTILADSLGAGIGAAVGATAGPVTAGIAAAALGASASHVFSPRN